MLKNLMLTFGGEFEYEPTNKIEAYISNKPVDSPELGGGKRLIEAGLILLTKICY